MTNIYIYPFIKSFLISIAFTGALVWLAKKFPSVCAGFRKRGQALSGRICRIGGIALIGSFALAVFSDPNLIVSPELWAVFISIFFILLFGIWDDFRELDWKTQLFFQVLIAVFIFIAGIRVEFVSSPFGGIIPLNVEGYFFPSLIFGIGWIVILMNAVNWLDGIDGLSGGVGILGSLSIFFLSLRPEVNQPPVGIITAAFGGSLLGLLIFNFYPARILAGTSGSMFIGFMIGVLAIFSGAKVATALLVMAIPIVDALYVIFERAREGKSIFRKDNRHLHYKLLEIGWSQRKVVFFYYALTLIITLIGLKTRTLGKFVTLLVVFLVMSIFLIYINNKLKILRKQK
jgi:UDP-GlcNAc:undecaprenyl-phosphate GlcNAc-1-phosphate transferase